jgi:4-hydroxybenzoyl-CoA reductase subunit alpha
MGFSEAVNEEVIFDKNGRIVNADLGGYRIITALDMPAFTNDLVLSNDEPATPWGLKEIGEGSNNPTMGAVRNAIYHAIGVDVPILPLSYEQIWRAIKKKQEKDAEAAK